MNDTNYKSALILGMCYDHLPDNGEDINYSRLSEYISSLADFESMTHEEKKDFDRCQKELLSYQGYRPSMLIRRWQERNDLADRFGLGQEISPDVLTLFDAGIRSYRPEPINQNISSDKPKKAQKPLVPEPPMTAFS